MMMRIKQNKVLFLAATMATSIGLQAAAFSAPPPTRIQALRFGRLVDGNGKVIQNAVVITENDRIRTVGDASTPIPDGAVVSDLSPYTALPGLIDSHTHLTYYFDPRSEAKPFEQLLSRSA